MSKQVISEFELISKINVEVKKRLGNKPEYEDYSISRPLVSTSGESNWTWSIGDPVRSDDETVAVEKAVVTEFQKAYEIDWNA